jgi:hypothetical protein
MPTSPRENRLIEKYKFMAKHMSDCEFKDREIPINECSCVCYEVFWIRVGAASIKAQAVSIAAQCETRDTTLKKLVDAINDIN